MPDKKIIDMLNRRDESAIRETAAQYGSLLRIIIGRILPDPSDAEECLNDTYLNIWNAIPPAAPDNLRAYVCKTARNLALDRYKHDNRKKRRTPATEEIAAELAEAMEQDWSAPLVDQMAFNQIFNRFLRELTPQQRAIFLKRYWLLMECGEIAADTGIKLNTVKTILARTRQKLAEHLEKEGITL